MQITFCGAAGTVTGSCYLVESEQTRFLVDCGMFQGSKEIRSLNREHFLFNPGEIDFVLLTHAHVDHAGLLPKLWKSGFRGPIYATKATVDLCGIVLVDSGHIQEMESEWRTRKKQRSGVKVEEPLYTVSDAQGCLTHFRPENYNEYFQPQTGVTVKFHDAGHILGSAIVEVKLTEAGETVKIVFSGDLGQKEQPIINDPTYIEGADYLVIESTYGDRIHEEHLARTDLLQQIIRDTVKSGGNLVIPAFAVGRTQDLLYHLKTFLQQKAIPELPVYIDSPMAVSVTEIYRGNPDCYDEPTRALFAAHESPFEFKNLHFIRSAEDSKRLNETANGAVIISANGMCEAGRILHHLKHNLWRPEAHILFVGYQAEGTLGRRLLDGAKIVKIMGETIAVQAKIHSIDGFSAHADQPALLDWIDHLNVKPKKIFITHGENGAQETLARLIDAKLGRRTLTPRWGDRIVLNAEMEVQPVTAVYQETQDYRLEERAGDLEHAVLNLRQQLKQADYSQSQFKLDEVKRILTEVELLLKKSS